jgi:hypothetical protein
METAEIVGIGVGTLALFLSVGVPLLVAGYRERQRNRYKRYERQPHEPLGMRGIAAGQAAHIVVDGQTGEGTRP